MNSDEPRTGLATIATFPFIAGFLLNFSVVAKVDNSPFLAIIAANSFGGSG